MLEQNSTPFNVKKIAGMLLLFSFCSAKVASAVEPITFYSECDYQGDTVAFDLGEDYRKSDILNNVGNNTISSVKVADGYQVTLSDGFDHTGRTIVLTTDDSCLDDNIVDNKSMDERISSFQVRYNAAYESPFNTLLGLDTQVINQRLIDDWAIITDAFLDRHSDAEGVSYARWLQPTTPDVDEPPMSDYKFTLAQMGHAMNVSVHLDKKDDFDALFREAKRTMYQSDTLSPNFGLYSATVFVNNPGDAGVVGISSTYGVGGAQHFSNPLVLAGNRWGNDGEIDYHQAVRDILEQLNSTANGQRSSMFIDTKYGSRMPMNLKFGHRQNTMSSPPYYHAEHYPLWASLYQDGDSQRNLWCERADDSRDTLTNTFAHPTTGFVPNKALFDGTPEPDWPNEKDDSAFETDPQRLPMTTSIDAIFYQNTWGRDLNNKILTHFYDDVNDGISGIKRTVYSHDGETLVLSGGAKSNDKWSLSAMLAVATLNTDLPDTAASELPQNKLFVQDLWDVDVTSQTNPSSYHSVVYMVGLVTVAGLYTHYLPASEVQQLCL
ncbi:MAG TPA: hypothetical protein DIS98_02140 [Colwellia sp.]|nr:hypothetical protein [Colwellia sp.]